MIKLEEAVKEDNKFADAYWALNALTDIAKEMPNVNSKKQIGHSEIKTSVRM